MKINPPMVAFLLMIKAIILHTLIPQPHLISKPYSYSGILLILAGLSLGAWALILFEKKKTTHKPHEKPSALVTQGIFKMSRNPIYLGMFLILLGCAILLGTLTSFLAPIIFIFAISKYFVEKEEIILEKTFGIHYKRYKKSTRRWI